jgi:Fe-S-cluster containining protein
MSAAPIVGKADCSRCDAVCCRLLVLVDPEDRIPEHLTTVTDRGLTVMARDEEGWCVAVDGARMNCSIYDSRPDVCRRFRMGGPYCDAIREDYARARALGIPLRLEGDPA